MAEPDPRWIGAALAERAPLLFGVTGSGSSLALIEGFVSNGGRYVPMASEAAAGLAAAGAWAASGDPAAAVSIKGPGVANLVPALAFAHLERRPLLTIAESNPAGAVPERRHKHIDHRRLLVPLLRCHASAVAEGDAMDQLLVNATAPVAGPVHMDLSAGPGMTCDEPEPEPWAQVDAGSVGEPGRACLVIGSAAREWAADVALGDLQLPVFSTVGARGVIDESHPSAAGVFTGVGGASSIERAVVEAADRVLAIGVSADELLGVPGEKRVPVRLDAAADAIARTGVAGWASSLLDRARAAERRALESPGWWPGDIADALDELDGPLAVVSDTGAFATFLEHRWRVTADRRADGSANGRYMGVAIGLTVGWGVAQGTAVCCVEGDGGAPAHFVELRTAAQHALAVCVIVVADGRFSSVIGARSGAAASPGLVPATDWVAASRSLGVESTRVRGADALRKALGEWDRRRPIVIEASFDSWEAAALKEVRG